MSDNSEEKFFLSDPRGLQISNKRIVVESKTYALNLVTSVDVNSQRTGPWLLFGKPAFLVLSVLWLLTFGLLGVAGSLLGFSPAIAWFTIFISIVLTLVRFMKKKDLQYWIEIATASGTEQVLCCGDDKDYALEIVEAINQAIVSK